MKPWTTRQRQLIADYFNNISAGWFLLGVITPFLGGVRLDQISLIKIFFSLIFSAIIIGLGILIIKR